FKNRYAFHNVKLCGEAASADEASARAFPPTVKKLIQEEGYTLDQIFNLDETGLYWKRMPTRTYISKNEAHAPGFKAAKDRVTVLLGANASGDLKLKHVLIMRQVTLPPLLSFDNIKVLFLPPNTTSLLQPMDQGVIAAFKAYYLRRTFKKLIEATEEENDKQVGFAEVESADVEELLESHCEDLSTEDLQQLVAAGEIEDAEDEEVQDAKPRELPTSVLSSILREVDKQLQILEDNDYNAKRSRIA
ncbi:tigger transposable element-derived protein 1-like, partial [Homarus americanus]|uniref:tigger transposable element-derived protein 1-like n=1 Tax=Homarus americanus TaxID=6706 RepID=UPI001C482C73